MADLGAVNVLDDALRNRGKKVRTIRYEGGGRYLLLQEPAVSGIGGTISGHFYARNSVDRHADFTMDDRVSKTGESRKSASTLCTRLSP